MRYTKSSLIQLQKLIQELGYSIRYEKGNFQSGFCFVQDRKVVIINKFFKPEARFNSLLDILTELRLIDNTLNSSFGVLDNKEFRQGVLVPMTV